MFVFYETGRAWFINPSFLTNFKRKTCPPYFTGNYVEKDTWSIRDSVDTRILRPTHHLNRSHILHQLHSCQWVVNSDCTSPERTLTFHFPSEYAMAATGIDPSSFGTFSNNVIAGNNFVTLGMLAWKHLTPKSIFIILLHTHTHTLSPLLFNHKKRNQRNFISAQS